MSNLNSTSISIAFLVVISLSLSPPIDAKQLRDAGLITENGEFVLRDGFKEIAGPPLWINQPADVAQVDLRRVRIGDFNADGLVDIYYIEGFGTTSQGKIYLNQITAN